MPVFLINLQKYSKKKPLNHFFRKLLHKSSVKESGLLSNKVFDYEEMVNKMAKKEPKDYKYFRSVFPSWDNSARRAKDATVFVNSSPEKFKEWVAKTAEYTYKNFSGEERLMFVNAWNEWAEGCHLEPDQQYGHRYLQALKDGLESK